MTAGARRLWRSIHRAQVFTPAECRSLVALADTLPGWDEARVLHQGERQLRRGRRRARQLSVAGPNADPALGDRLAPWLERIERLVRDLDARHLRLGVRGVHDAQLVDYRRGGFFAWHPDSRDLDFRKLTALCYLTDRDSDGLVGGETVFAPPSLRRLLLGTRLRRSGAAWLHWLPVVQAPRQGRAIVFDARIVHRAHRVRR
ncbi:MAG: 2OG-Fe(II) oxygenase family protein [Myxococcota bacterium]